MLNWSYFGTERHFVLLKSHGCVSHGGGNKRIALTCYQTEHSGISHSLPANKKGITVRNAPLISLSLYIYIYISLDDMTWKCFSHYWPFVMWPVDIRNTVSVMEFGVFFVVSPSKITCMDRQATMGEHINTEATWPPFCGWNFQMFF